MAGSRLPAIGMLILFVGATATVVVASDVIASRPFCPTCESTSANVGDAVTFEDALTELDPAAGGIQRSTLDLQLFRNGTVVWTARNTLSADVSARLQDNTTFRQRLLDRIEFDETPVGEPDQLTLRVRNDTAIVRVINSHGASHRFGGVLFFTAHKATGHIDSRHDIWWSLNADRVTISGPPGWVITQSPRLRDYRIVNESLVWETPPDEESGYNNIQPREAYVFAPSSGVGATVFTHLHRVVGGIPAATVWLFMYGSLPAIVLLVGFALLGRVIHARLSPDRTVSLRRQSVVVVGIGLVASLASILYVPLIGAGLVYLFIGGCGYLIWAADDTASPRLLGGVAALAIVLAVIVWIVLTVFERDSSVMEVQALALHSTAGSILAMSLPFGAFWQSGEQYMAPLLVFIPFVLLVVATGIPSFPEAEAWIAIGVLTGASVVSVLAGAPLAYLGASLIQSRQ